MLKLPLFPGLIFLECEQEIPQKKSRLMQDQDSGAMQVDSRIEEFLRELGGEAHHVSMSRGVIRNGVTICDRGTAGRKEAKIQKIDRHKRLAKIGGGLNVPFCQEGDSGQALKSLPKVKGGVSVWRNWYAMKTMSEKEEEAAELIRRTIPSLLVGILCTILQKKKPFRADGKLILSMEKMFQATSFTNETGSRMCQKC
ncbi:MAG: hypothetical protein ACLUUO_02115 [Sellimonas intestinalis]